MERQEIAPECKKKMITILKVRIQMDFTKELYLATNAKHQILDTHPFVKSIINKNENAFQKYIHFHYVVFDKIQVQFKKYDLPDFFIDLYRKIPDDITTSNTVITNYLHNMTCDNLQDLLVYVYMFYLGILKGGNILNKFYPDSIHNSLFIFSDKNLLVNQLKDYLNKTIINQQEFIHKVNVNYTQINIVFTSLNDSPSLDNYV